MEKEYYSMQNTSFSYYKSPLFLNNASFSMEKFDKILLLASKGMGKTTFLAVASNFFDNYSGKIFLNGEELKTIPDKNKNFSFLP